MNYSALEEKGLNIQGLGLAGAASCSAALSAVRQPSSRAFGLAFIRRPAIRKKLKIGRKIHDGSWGGFVGWTVLIPKILDKQLRIFLLFSISHSSLREGSACTLGYTHAWPTEEMRTRSGVLGLICASFTYSNENIISPSTSNIQRY